MKVGLVVRGEVPRVAPNDEPVDRTAAGAKDLESLDDPVLAFVGLQPADNADDEAVFRNVQVGAGVGCARGWQLDPWMNDECLPPRS
jgi:hypothetical protein